MKSSPDDKVEELREVTREANGTLKDLRAALREARGIAPGLTADMQSKMNALIAELSRDVRLENAKALELARARNAQTLDDTEVRIVERINNLVDILLGKRRIKNIPKDLEAARPSFDVEHLIETTDWSQYVDGPIHEVKEDLPPALLRQGEGNHVQVITVKGVYETESVKYVTIPKWDKKKREHVWLYAAHFVHPDPWSQEYTMGPHNMVREGTSCRWCLVDWTKDVDRVCAGPSLGAKNLEALIGGVLNGKPRNR